MKSDSSTVTFSNRGLTSVTFQSLVSLENKENRPHDKPITTVDFSRNKIVSISNDAFVFLQHSLSFLNLSENCLETIPIHALELPNLQVLDLSKNFINTTGKLTLPNLKYIDLSSNRLISIPSLTESAGLSIANFSSNPLSNLKNVAFHLPKNKLQTLALRNTAFSDLTQVRYLTTFEQLEVLDISETPMIKNVINFRPFVLNWCLLITQLNGVLVSPEECVFAEWLFTDGYGRKFSTGNHDQLVSYLNSLKFGDGKADLVENWVKNQDPAQNVSRPVTVNSDHEGTILDSESEFIPIDFSPPRVQKDVVSKESSDGFFNNTSVDTSTYDYKPLKPMSTKTQLEIYGKARPKENAPSVKKRPPKIERKSIPFFQTPSKTSTKNEDNISEETVTLSESRLKTPNKKSEIKIEDHPLMLNLKNQVSDLESQLKYLETQLIEEKNLRIKQTEAIRYMWGIIQSTMTNSQNSSMISHSEIPTHTHQESRPPQAFYNRRVNFDNVDTSTPAKSSEVIEKPVPINVSLVRKDIGKVAEEEDSDLDSNSSEENANLTTETVERKVENTTSIAQSESLTFAEILQKNNSHFPEKVLWVIAFKLVDFLETSETTYTSIIHPSNCFVNLKSFTVWFQSNVNLSEREKASYVPASGSCIVYRLS